MTLNTPLPFFVGCFCADSVKDNVRQHGGLLVGWKPPTKEAGGCSGVVKLLSPNWQSKDFSATRMTNLKREIFFQIQEPELNFS